MEEKRTSVTDGILERLESNILSGVWKPGDKIDTEIALSKELNVSRASVHSAIQQMVAIGVLESHQGKGTYVRSIPLLEIKSRLNSLSKSTSLRKIMEFRIMLEGEVCLNIAGHLSREAAAEMESHLKSMEENSDDPARLAHYDVLFHSALARATNNDFIIQSMNIVCDETERQNAFHSTEEGVRWALVYHRRILDCLISGDGLNAKRHMITHLKVAACDPPFDDSTPFFSDL